MTVLVSPVVTGAARIGIFILTVCLLLVLYRIIRGPHHADRIIALDLLSILVVALTALFAVFFNNAIFIDVSIAYALVAFLGTASFARYLERSEKNHRNTPSPPKKKELP